MNRETIKNNKECFDWWLEEPGRKVWVGSWVNSPGRGTHHEWYRITPSWTNASMIYIQDDEYADLRKAHADGIDIYVSYITRPGFYKITQPRFDKHISRYYIDEPWRAKYRKDYYCVSTAIEVLKDYDSYSNLDDTRYKAGNYFKTYEEAEKIACKFKAILLENNHES